MNIIKKISEIENPDYYVPCTLPLITKEAIKQQLPLYTSLLSNCRLLAVPNYRVFKNEAIQSNVHFSQDLIITPYFERFGIFQNYNNFENFDIAFLYLEKMMSENKGISIGVSTYYLPYSIDYLNNNYIQSYNTRTIGTTNHYVSIIKIDKKNRKVKIFDTKPYLREEWISFNSFHLAWKGDSKIDELQHIKDIHILKPYTYFETTFLKNLDEETVVSESINLLENILSNCLSKKIIYNTTYNTFFGLKASEKCIEDMREIISITKQYTKLEQYIICLIEFKINRFFLRDFYIDLCQLDKKFLSKKKSIENLVDSLDKIISKLVVQISRKHINEVSILQSLNSFEIFIEKETKIYKQILTITKK